MLRCHVRCPVCGARIPLYGDEPVESFNVIDCQDCGTGVDYGPADIIPEGLKDHRPRPFHRDGKPHPNPPRWRYPPT